MMTDVECSAIEMNNPESPWNEPKGVLASDWKLIRAHHEALLNQIRQSLDLPTSDFHQVILPVIDAFIRYCHLLPASENHHHAEPGGLVRHSLEVTVHAMRRSEAFLYGREKSPALQSSLDMRWRTAIAIGSLLHDLGKVVTDMTVVARCNDEESEWNPFLTGLWDWLNDHHIERYYLIWRPRRFGRHEVASIFTTRHLISPDCIEYLGRFGSEVPTTLFESLAGVNQEDRFGILIREADRDSVSRDLRGHPLSMDPARGKPKEQLILSLLRRPIVRGDWITNNNDCCFWLIDGEIYIDWFLGMQVIRRGLEQDGIRTLSDDEDDIADILIERGIAWPEKRHERYHFIQLRPDKAAYRLLRLSTKQSIVPTGSIPPFFHVHDASHSIKQANIETRVDEKLNVMPDPKGHVLCESVPDLAWVHQIFNLSGPCAPAMLGHQIWMPYPLLFETLGMHPVEALKMLDSQSVLERDPDMKMKLVWEYAGHRGAVLTETFSNELISNFGKPRGLPPDQMGHELSRKRKKPSTRPIKTVAPIQTDATPSKSEPVQATTKAKVIISGQDDLLNQSRLDAIRKSFR